MVLNKKKTKVLLIFIGSFHLRGNQFKHYVPPLGISLLSSFIRQYGYQTRQVDLRLLTSFERLAQEVDRFSPHIIGLSVLTSEMDTAQATIKFLHAHYPHTKIIVGGPHATVLPQDVAANTDVFAAVIGEGELSLLELIRAIETHRPRSLVRGIAFRHHNQVILTPPQAFISDLDQLPFADRQIVNSSGWNSAAYELFFPMRYPLANIIVSRGCPGRCAMCQPTLDKIFGRPTRFRSPENVIAEIKRLIHLFHIKSLIFWDDTLTANRPWLDHFCQLISKENIHLDWWCYSRVNNINQSVLDTMKKAGCKMICFGIESGSQRVLNQVIRKGTTVNQNINAIDLCHQNGILSNANVMIGSPTETLEEVKMTDRLLTRTKPDIVWASVTSPLPGTYLGDKALADGLVVTSKWSDFTRGQIGKTKIKTDLKTHDIIKYQTRWHKTRFQPFLLFKKYYFLACLRLALCHLHEHRPHRILSDFLVGPIIEFARKLYWRNLFVATTSTVPLFSKHPAKNKDNGTNTT